MKSTNKLIKLCVPFEAKIIKDEHGNDEELVISGFASTADTDRDGDVIVSDAWKSPNALSNFLKNPIILAFHDHRRPIGKAISHEVSDKGLHITAKISKAAGEIIQLIKDEILGAFSVGFIIKDADLDHKTGAFIIKDLELFEVSVVSVPANQNALFNISKNFSSKEEYEEYKKQFCKSNSEETLMKETEKDSVDLKALADSIKAQVVADLKAAEEAKKAKEEAEKLEAEKISGAAKTAAERIVEDFKKELNDKDSSVAEALKSISEAVKSNKEELEKLLAGESKMRFAEEGKGRVAKLTDAQKDGLLYVSLLSGKPVDQTKAFRNLVEKSGMEHWDAGVVGEWEASYNTRIYDAMRESLVVEPLFTSIPMTTPTMYLPINPEAGDATWVHEAAYRSSRNPSDETGDGSDTSTGEAQNHQLDEQILVARKLATREYIGYEEEEDSIVALAPVINDAISRRMARAADLALLRGTGVTTNTASYDPLLGLENRGGSTTDVDVAGGAAWATNFDEDSIANLRRNLGIYGLDPQNLVLIASHNLYYEIMKLPNFKTIDVMGSNATLITGQVGSIWGVPVIVSQMFNNAAITAGTVGTTLGILARPSNFVVGNLRGLMTESATDVINQKRAIVSSRRMAFQDIITGQGTVNLSIAS